MARYLLSDGMDQVAQILIYLRVENPMPYVPGCRRDIFISYASENDRERWVTSFVERLGAELEELLGRRFAASRSIYFDRRELRAGDNFPDELGLEAEHSALLIPIVSPGYLDSAWCEQERIAFEKRMPEGATLANCLAPIQIRPVDTLLPPALERDRTTIFSFVGPDGHRPLGVGSPEWTARVNQLAVQIVAKLKLLRSRYPPIYVGRSPSPNVTLRERVSVHLERISFRTTNDPDERLALAVHFIGGSDGDDADFERLEVIERAHRPDVPSYLFQPFGVPQSTAESAWVEMTRVPFKLIRDKNEQELLDVLESELTRLVAVPTAGGGVVLACEPVDDPRVRAIERDLPTDLEIRRTEFHLALTAAERLRRWNTLIRQARTLVFFWGNSDQGFLNKLESYATRQTAAQKSGWYLLEPEMDSKREARPNGLLTTQELRDFLGNAPGPSAAPPP